MGIVLMVLSACAAAPGAVAGAAINTTVAVTASAVSRASGGCYAACPVGTQCNRSTGFCDPLPCRGLCSTDEVCEINAVGERCVPKAQSTLRLPGERSAPSPGGGETPAR